MQTKDGDRLVHHWILENMPQSFTGTGVTNFDKVFIFVYSNFNVISNLANAAMKCIGGKTWEKLLMESIVCWEGTPMDAKPGMWIIDGHIHSFVDGRVIFFHSSQHHFIAGKGNKLTQIRTCSHYNAGQDRSGRRQTSTDKIQMYEQNQAQDRKYKVGRSTETQNVI